MEVGAVTGAENAKRSAVRPPTAPRPAASTQNPNRQNVLPIPSPTSVQRVMKRENNVPLERHNVTTNPAATLAERTSTMNHKHVMQRPGVVQPACVRARMCGSARQRVAVRHARPASGMAARPARCVWHGAWKKVNVAVQRQPVSVCAVARRPSRQCRTYERTQTHAVPRTVPKVWRTKWEAEGTEPVGNSRYAHKSMRQNSTGGQHERGEAGEKGEFWLGRFIPARMCRRHVPHPHRSNQSPGFV